MYIIEVREKGGEVLEPFQTVEPEILVAVMRILSGEDDSLRAALDQLPTPLYVTDAEGVVRYFNPRLHRLCRAHARHWQGQLVYHLEALHRWG